MVSTTAKEGAAMTTTKTTKTTKWERTGRGRGYALQAAPFVAVINRAHRRFAEPFDVDVYRSGERVYSTNGTLGFCKAEAERFISEQAA